MKVKLIIIIFILIILFFAVECQQQQFPARFWQQPSQDNEDQRAFPPPPPNYRFIPFENEDERVEERRWSLIPTRSPPRPTTTTTRITETTEPPATSTTTTSTPPPTTTPFDPCEFYDDIALLHKLKENGLFNSVYMAPDFFTASKTFPDLGDRSFTISGDHQYHCDKQCEKESQIIRGIIGSTTRKSVMRSQVVRNSKFANSRVTEAPRTWWRPSFWRREKRDDAGDDENMEIKPRSKRSAAELALKNSGKTEGILGTTIALQCDEAIAEEVPANGYHLCRNCRAVRQLPETYFPRILNEVICAEGDCLRGEGKCQQRYLPFRILRNFGTSRCPHWRETDIQIRTCCDCVIHPNSPFLKYIIPPD